MGSVADVVVGGRPEVGVAAAEHAPAEREFSASGDLAELPGFFRDRGYAVVRGLVPRALCEAGLRAFDEEVRHSRDYFIRHEVGRYERHVYTEHGFMKYPIMNVQDLSAPRYAGFRRAGLDILAHEGIQKVMRSLLGEPGRVIHTMYFDGNQVTWPHRDSHYIDSEEVGRMIGAWVAAEDIHPGAGRFYVRAGSHAVPSPGQLGLDSLDPNTAEYKAAIGRYADEAGFPLVSPVLRQGDVLFWSSLTIHGSLPTTEPRRSRRSFTAHYIPDSHHFLGMRRSRGSEEFIHWNGARVTLHQDQCDPKVQRRARLRNAVLPPALYKRLRRLKQAARGLLK